MLEKQVLYLVSNWFVLALPLPKGKFVSWSIGSIINLLLYNEYNAIFTCADQLTKYCRLMPCFVVEVALSASLVAKLLFNIVVKFFGFLHRYFR